MNRCKQACCAKWRPIAWVLVALLLSVQPGLAGTNGAAHFGGKYNVPLSSEPETLDPAFITESVRRQRMKRETPMKNSTRR